MRGRKLDRTNKRNPQTLKRTQWAIPEDWRALVSPDKIALSGGKRVNDQSRWVGRHAAECGRV